MQALKENKILFTWLIVAFCAAIYGSQSTKNFQREGNTQELDTLIYFDFSAKQKQELHDLFYKLNKKHGFNGVALVGQRDSIFYQGIHGYSNFQIRDSLTEKSSFQLASVSKQFTAVAILQLYEKGLLNLNDSVQKFFPKFPYKNITIHQLLVHRAGLANYHYFFQHIPTTADTLLSNTDVVNEMINKAPKAYYSPNRRYHYSNTGYALLASIVEQVTQLTFTEYLNENIFEPLEMYNSFAYRGDDGSDYENITTGYLRRWRRAEDNYLDGVLGDKGVYCSSEDLFKWDQGLYSNKIISYDTLKMAFKPMGKPKHYKSNYGYGWRIMNWGDSLQVNFHLGWWHGYKSLLMRIPSDSTTIIILKNRSTGTNVSTKRILNLLYPINHEITDSIQMNSISLNE